MEVSSVGRTSTGQRAQRIVDTSRAVGGLLEFVTSGLCGYVLGEETETEA